MTGIKWAILDEFNDQMWDRHQRTLLTDDQYQEYKHNEKVTKMTLHTLNAPYREWQKSIAAIHGRGHTPVTTQSHP